jgi:hypothetical protein
MSLLVVEVVPVAPDGLTVLLPRFAVLPVPMVLVPAPGLVGVPVPTLELGLAPVVLVPVPVPVCASMMPVVTNIARTKITNRVRMSLPYFLLELRMR